MAEKPPARYEDRKADTFVKEFLGINTQPDRTAIDPRQFAWLENLMPIGYANMRTVPRQSASLLALGSVLSYWRYGNISNVDYLFCFLSDGSAVQVNISTFATIAIAAAGTFTGTPAVSQWKNERILIVASNNYWDWNGAALTALGGVTAAPSAGTYISTFAGRVWIADGRTIYYSAPASYTDFQTISAGGVDVLTDESLRSVITGLYATNSFLYIFGTSSINVYSDVRVSAGVTIFSNNNITGSIGTPYPNSIFAYYRGLMFVTDYGVFQLIGATPRKLSDDLDGIFDHVDFSVRPSGGQTMLYKQLVASFLIRYAPDGTTARTLLAMFFNGKWFLASQGDSLTHMAAAFVSGVPTLFASDGTNVYRMFYDTSANIDTTFITALQPFKKPWVTKQGLKVAFEIKSDDEVLLTATADSESSSVPIVQSAEVLWVNASLAPVTWFSVISAVTWIRGGYQFFQSNVEQWGRYLGYTVQSSSPQFRLTGIIQQTENRAEWAGR